jgi:Transglycosylase SLT domain
MQQSIRQNFQFSGRYLIGKIGLCVILLATIVGAMTGLHSSQAHAETLHTQTAANGSYTDMIHQVFGAYGDQAVRIAECESTMNPNAYNGVLGAAGLFQIIPSTWASTSEAGQSVYNPAANIQAAHEIFVRDGNSFAEWQCQA